MVANTSQQCANTPSTARSSTSSAPERVQKRYVWNERCSLCGANLREAEVLFRINDEQELIRCRECTLVSNSQFRADLENVYDAGYFETSEKQAEGGYFSYRELESALNADYKFAFDFISQKLRGRNGPTRILDVGCGYGFFLRQFLGMDGVDLHGIELSASAAAIARESLPQVVQTPIEEAKFDREFDFVVSFEVIEHLFDPSSFLERVKSIVAKDGFVLMTTPNIASPWFAALGRRWPALHPDSHNHYFTPKTIRALAERHGLEVVSLQERQVLHKTVRQLRKRLDEMFPGSGVITAAAKPLDPKVIPFLSGGSVEIVLRRAG